MFEEVSMFKFKIDSHRPRSGSSNGFIGWLWQWQTKMTQQEGVLRVGSETTFPPFEFTEGDKYVGFDVDLSEAIAKNLVLKWNSNPWASMLWFQQFNLAISIWSQQVSTPEREKALDFSDVYFDQGGFITVVRKDNTTIHNMDELAGQTVGAQIGTIPVEMAQKSLHTTVKQIDSNANIFLELKAGTIDGAIIDNAVAMYYLKQGADQDLKLVGEPTKAEGTVLGVKKATKLYKKLLTKLLKNLKKTALTKNLRQMVRRLQQK